jgi:HlyD family secretion protein
VVTYSVILSIQNKDLRLKPGMTANIKIMVASLDDVLKVPNAALRYHLPGTPAPSFGMALAGNTATKAIAQPGQGVSLPQAPGQKWNPGEKLRFATFDPVQNHEGRVFVLDAGMKTIEKKVVLGLSDGAMTQVISGEIKSGEEVVVGDGTQVDTQVNVQRGQRRGAF